jgi:uncharacterized protein YjbI with pentapeptide repeats
LKGSRFYKANLANADFTGANLVGVSLEGANLEGTIFKDALAEVKNDSNISFIFPLRFYSKGAYFSETIADAQSIENVDFTDAQMPDYAKKKLCARPDSEGTNPTTGVNTKESLFCL